MKVGWRRKALADIEEIADHIAFDDISAADRMRHRIRDWPVTLADHPEIGRSGRIPGTRELVIAGTPYIVAYRVDEGLITILRVIRGTRRWPRRM